ncbi:MAG: ABC transporter ATP-binding protein [Ilumatobacteraceae bacterium]
MSGDVVLAVDHLVKSFRLHHQRANSLKQFIAARGRNRYEEFVAVNDVTFDVREGEVFGVIGQNGSGKSTLLKCMAGILQPNSGNVRVSRRMGALLELGAGFHPDLTGRENVFLNAAILGMPRKEIALHFDAIVDFSGLHTFIDQPVKTYSSGMYVRLAFAVAINVDPQLLIIDEILAVGDVSFQRRCMEKFVEFRDDGRTIVLVTHDMGSVKNLCDRAIWLEHGKAVDEGDPGDLVEAYTERMLGAYSRTADGGHRQGSGEIRITQVEMFVNAGTTPVKRFRTGDDVRLRLHYESEQTVPQPVIGIEIESVGGSTISAPNTRDVGLVPTTMSGNGDLEVSFAKVALLPGSYDLHTSITDFNRAKIYDRLQNAMRFDVMTGKPYETEGVVTLSPQWTL